MGVGVGVDAGVGVSVGVSVGVGVGGGGGGTKPRCLNPKSSGVTLLAGGVIVGVGVGIGGGGGTNPRCRNPKSSGAPMPLASGNSYPRGAKYPLAVADPLTPLK